MDATTATLTINILPRWSILTFDGRLIVLDAATRREADRMITARGLAAMRITPAGPARWASVR